MQLLWACFILVQHLIEKELYLKIQTYASAVRKVFVKRGLDAGIFRAHNLSNNLAYLKLQ